LREDAFDYMGLLDPGELHVEAAELVGEARVVDPEAVQHGGVQVAEVDRVLGDVVGEVVGGPILHAAPNPAPGEPDAEAAAVVVAPHARVAELPLAEGGAAELGGEEDERIVEQAALLEVLD